MLNRVESQTLRFFILAGGVFFLAVVLGVLFREMDERNQFRFLLNNIGIPGFGPSGSEDPYEENFLRRRHSDAPELTYEIHENFHAYLMEASGFDELQLETVGERESRFDEWRDIGVREYYARYQAPDVELTALFREGRRSSEEKLVVLLHGLRSTAAMAIGVDGLDYMSEFGNDLVDNGYDVLVPELPSSPIMASAIQSRFLILDRSSLGVFPRFTCDLIASIDAQQDYDRIIVYGIRYGARLAEVFAQLCDLQIERVIMDGQAQPWRRSIQDAALRSRVQSTVLFQHRRALLANSSFLDFFAAQDAIPRLYLLDSESLDSIEAHLDANFSRSNAVGSEGVIIARREIDYPFLNRNEIFAIISGEYDYNDSYTLLRK